MNNNDYVVRNDSYNDNFRKNSSPETIVIINCALNGPLIFFCIIANTLVLVAILRNRSLHTPSAVFLCFLTSSDLLVGIVAQPLYIIHELNVTSILKNAMHVLTTFTGGVSICFMAAISVDRFLALNYHMRYAEIMTTKRAIYTSVVLLLFCCSISCLPLWNKVAYHSGIAVGITACILISIFSYIQIFRIVRRHQTQIHIQQQAIQDPNAQEDVNMMRLKKSAINTFIYFLFIMLCYSPLLASMLVLAIKGRQETKTWRFADTLSFANSSINPFLYYWRIKELRTAILIILRPLLCKQAEEH
ncbi:melanocyte-stimulating hormone receptor-like [Montipora capricornis]|uniref:melanocyte-stimulating hormone receptor-like n=1 Tax=Montipora capricornis TaxID=246305 RepID=UPI0035F15FA9